MSEASTVAQAFQATAAAHPERVALRTKGDEFSITWREYADRVRDTAGGLAALGLERGQTLALLLTNRPEFHWFDAAALHLGATPFSLYNTYTRGADRVPAHRCREREFWSPSRRLRSGSRAFEGIEHLIVVEDRRAAGARPTDFDFDAAWRAVEPDDLLTLIYTSGTTGPPKGVEITHANMVADHRGRPSEMIEFPDDGRLVSWLPMAHIAERNCTQYLPMFVGFSTTCCPDPRQVVAYLPEVRPTWFFAVPRIWEKLKAAIEAGIEAEQDEEKKQATTWALDLGLRKVRGEERRTGGAREGRRARAVEDPRACSASTQVEAVNVGAAPTPPEVIEFFHALGIPLGELWGMSETTGYGAVNPPDAIRIGTVGPPAPGAEIKLADDGEVLIRGAVHHDRLPEHARPDERGDRRRRLAPHRRHRRVRRRGLPEARRPQEGADHQRGREEHVAREHRGEAEGREPR